MQFARGDELKMLQEEAVDRATRLPKITIHNETEVIESVPTRGLVKGSGGGADSFNAILIKTEESTSYSTHTVRSGRTGFHERYCLTLTVREGWTVVHERYRSILYHIVDIVCESWTVRSPSTKVGPSSKTTVAQPTSSAKAGPYAQTTPSAKGGPASKSVVAQSTPSANVGPSSSSAAARSTLSAKVGRLPRAWSLNLKRLRTSDPLPRALLLNAHRPPSWRR